MDLSYLDGQPLANMLAEYAATYPTDAGPLDPRSYSVGMMIGVAMMTAPMLEEPDPNFDVVQYLDDVNRQVAVRVAHLRATGK